MPDEVLEDNYREAHALTWWQMQDEPIDAIWEWVTVQNCRLKQKEMHARLHNANG